jgi:hypothetical protein
MTAPLAGLFAPDRGGRAAAPFRVGTLTAWDATTLRNTVVIDSVTYTNLAIVIPPLAAADYYAVGDSVLIGTTPGAPIILGGLGVPT